MSVIFYVVIMLHGHPPLQSRLQMESLDACLSAVKDVLSDNSEEMKDKFADGGSIQASCVIAYKPFGKQTYLSVPARRQPNGQ